MEIEGKKQCCCRRLTFHAFSYLFRARPRPRAKGLICKQFTRVVSCQARAWLWLAKTTTICPKDIEGAKAIENSFDVEINLSVERGEFSPISGQFCSHREKDVKWVS